MSRFVFRKSNDPELPPNIVPELANMRIRIFTEGFPETGAQYYEGTVRKFVIERLPHPNLLDKLPLLLSQERFSYKPASETLVVERVD